MIDILHPPRFGFGMARNESGQEEDVAEDVVESVARERGNPTDVDGGEGVVARLEWMDAAEGETWYV
ncbi:hypothetical protein CTheo_4540 [Ceratobasidium theobromae]|uniref:Uncharacterized protein n=1 Tax=Ceratobasidium theobromae TaxID=1582974 RepID=A0A5N5QLG6_9AGAM|nr:hypothetical protein CTheo_4540 [Ceratobasidium theobromae]